MGSERIISRRIVNLAIAIPIWMLLTTSVNSFILGSYLVATLSAAMTVALIGILIDGRLATSVEGRPLPSAGFAILALILFVLALGAFQDLRYNELTVSGEIYVPGLITLIRVIGSIVLTLALVVEIVRLMRSTA